jgi:hypothetical protein
MALRPLQDLEDAEKAYERVKPELEALTADELSAMNVDLVSATSIALGVSERIVSHRERMAKLPEFDVRHVDKLVDYAKAAWFVYVTNLPAPEPAEGAQLMNEVIELRAKMLMWATPLVGAGKFDAAAIARIREGSGNKDAAGDLVALVGLYRARWEDVKGICAVTERDLTRGAEIGPAVFAMISRREFQTSTISDGSLRVRRAWTLLDRAYGQCRRGLGFLRFEEEDTDSLAPSLRRNQGNQSRPQPTERPPTMPAPVIEAQNSVPTAAPSVSAPSIGGGASPFVAKS